jgi:hypothetical protein
MEKMPIDETPLLAFNSSQRAENDVLDKLVQ